jgi:hypothetical protein
MGKRQRRRLREQRPPEMRYWPSRDPKRVGEDEAIEGLRELVVLRERIEREIDSQVDRLEGWGFSWPVIARGLGVTRQAARQRQLRRQRAS